MKSCKNKGWFSFCSPLLPYLRQPFLMPQCSNFSTPKTVQGHTPPALERQLSFFTHSTRRFVPSSTKEEETQISAVSLQLLQLQQK